MEATICSTTCEFVSVASGDTVLFPDFRCHAVCRDVLGVEMAGALKNVLAIAAGIVEGMDLGNNCMAALVAQGCAEIRWLAEKVRRPNPSLTVRICPTLVVTARAPLSNHTHESVCYIQNSKMPSLYGGLGKTAMVEIGLWPFIIRDHLLRYVPCESRAAQLANHF